MGIVEAILLVLVYTVLTLTLFLEIVSYRKNIEPLEAIFFTASLLLLIVVLTASYFTTLMGAGEDINIFTLLAMTLVGLTTPLNVIVERHHTLPQVTKKILFIVAIATGVLILAGYLFDFLDIAQYVVASFLGLSVVLSMILIMRTSPIEQFVHRERQQQLIAVAFLVIIPLTLYVDFSQVDAFALRTGFTVPMLFLILGASKLWDDIQRLSLFKVKHSVSDQDLNNYGFTNREKDVALLLIEGYSYKQISEKLFIAIPTVKTHATNIYKKCKVNNRIELMGLLGK